MDFARVRAVQEKDRNWVSEGWVGVRRGIVRAGSQWSYRALKGPLRNIKQLPGSFTIIQYSIFVVARCAWKIDLQLELGS